MVNTPVVDNLYQRFRERFSVTPETAFMTLLDGSVIRYGDLDAHSGRLANHLVALGVRPGDRVAIQVDKSPEAVFVYLATLRAGAIFLPLNPAYTAAEVGYFLGDAEPQVFIYSPERLGEMQPLAADLGVPHLATLGADGSGSLMSAAESASPDFADVDRAGSDLATILYTSGTTGRSKGAMLSIDNLWSNVETLREAWRYSSDDRLIHALPVFHAHGLFVALNITLASGASMFFLPKFDIDDIVGQLPQATVLMGVPTFYTRLLADDRFDRDLVAEMRLFVSGSAPLSAEVHREFAERTGHQILERYGMTETSMIASNPYDGERRPGWVGPGLLGVEVRICDPETGEVLPAGSVGAVEVRGPNVFSGYWRMPDKTAAEFRDDGFFITGDMGQLDDGGYLQLVGRSKDLIICGGYNVYPAEVEALLDEIPGVAESAVVAAPHADLGEGVVAVVAVSDSSVTADVVTGALADRLARYKQPRRVYVVDELPRNTMGKIQKTVLRERYADAFR